MDIDIPIKRMSRNWDISNYHQKLLSIFGKNKTNYVCKILTTDELEIIDDLIDTIIIARIKNMHPKKLKKYDKYLPINNHKYLTIQAQWLCTEKYLISISLGHSATDRELMKDFVEKKNGLRFRAFYCLKYPREVFLSQKL